VFQQPQIVGHSAQLSELLRDLETGNVSHAYLFSGPRHLGKMTLARWFAAELLCTGVDPANIDSVYHHIERLTHQDLFVLDQLWIEETCEDWNVIARTSNAPQQHRAKKPAAKTDSISIDDIRVLQERLYERANGKYRCCIIRSVERMQSAAANAFLKILEEPPPGLVFLLTTQALTSLLPTVISRTRVLRFRSLPHTELASLLEDVAEDDRQFILQIAQGAPGVASALRDDPDQLRQHRQIAAQARTFWDAPALPARLHALETLEERGEQADRFLLHLAITLREQGPSHSRVSALHRLARGLQTNVHRKLLLQQFALAAQA
jgi:DNA polymerase-3 subunit delta'